MRRFALLLCCWLPLLAQAELVIEITRGVDNPTRIAIVPLAWQGEGLLPEDIAHIVSADLNRSGQFMPLREDQMPLSLPHTPKDIVFSDWRRYNTEYIVIGRVEKKPEGGGYKVFFSLYDVHSQKQVFSKVVNGGENSFRDLAHYISDKIYEVLTGFQGHFSTKIVYVRVQRSPEKEEFQLLLADQDGARVQTLLRSKEPILSPTWSPDAKEVAYVSFEGRRPSIWRQEVRTGKRQKLTAFSGLNSAPAWSPDGTKMAMVLSKDDNPEIYVMDLNSGRLTRLTRHFSIDTEPSWMPDGSGIVFTSNRGGRPQIYRMTAEGKQLERLTFDGTYNARGRVTADGKHLVMVHRPEGSGMFHIAVQDFLTGQIHILTSTDLDESPTVAPNGRMMMYATKEGDQGILAAVSIDGGVKVRLPSQIGDVREPAWSPFR